jgi:hypothetical protein
MEEVWGRLFLCTGGAFYVSKRGADAMIEAGISSGIETCIWGLLGIRVISGHSDACPERQAFSVSIWAQDSACKINGFCMRFCKSLFGHCVSPPLPIVFINLIKQFCNVLF